MIYSLAFPEILMAISSLALLMWVAFRGEGSLISTTYMAVAVMVGAAVLTLRTETGVTFHDLFAMDDFRGFVKVMLLVASSFSLLIAPSYLKISKCAKPEYPVLVLLATLGMMVMVSANDLMTLYMGLELQNLALYVLVSMRRDDPRSSEAGMKYFTLSAFSSCLLLFGLSLVYGFAASTNFAAIGTALTEASTEVAGVAVGLVLILAGFAFKTSAVPFHMWTPDVYEGAPTPVTAFLAAAPKVAALSLLGILFAGPFAHVSGLWQPVLMVLAVISMLLGSFGGLLQSNIKRLMAYSAIANVGTLLIGLVVLGASSQLSTRTEGLYGFLLYLMLYFVGTLGVFAILALLSHRDKAIEKIDDLAGLSKKHPALAAAMAACLFSLAGVPPLAGFFGKYFVLLAAVKADLLPLALIGVLTSVVAAGYYLRIVKVMYFDAQSDSLQSVSQNSVHLCSAGVLALFVLMFFISPAPLMQSVQTAVESIIQ